MVMRNAVRDSLLTFRCINKCLESKELQDDQKLPPYLINSLEVGL